MDKKKVTAKKSQRRIHGWFPQEPAMGIIRSANINLKSGRWVPLPSLSVPLLIVAALLSLYFGSLFINSYSSNYIFYAGLPIAILHLAAFGLELFSAALLLTRKHTTLAVASMVIVLLLGLSIPLINMLDQPTTTGLSYFRFVNLLDPVMWMNGLFLGSPLIAFSAAGLIIIKINQRRSPGPPGVNAKTAVATLAVFWSIITAANLIQTNALIDRFMIGWRMSYPWAVPFAWLLGGVALGAVIGIAVTRLRLNNPPKQAKAHFPLMRWLFTIGAAIAVILLFTGFLSLGLPTDINIGLLNALFASLATGCFASAALFWRYEKRQNVWVRQNGLEIFAVAKESVLKSESSQTTKGPILLNFKSVVLSSIAAAGFAGLIFVLQDSWIRTVLIVPALVSCVVALLVKGKFRTFMKYAAVCIMISCLCFSLYESYAFGTVGGEPVTWPSSPIADISMQNMGNVSMGAIFRDLKQSETGALLKLENHELTVPRLIDIRMAEKGHITIYCGTKNANESVDCYSTNGNRFSVLVRSYSSPYPDLTDQDIQTSLDQIDALGLEWFYNQALEIAHNRTANLHTIDTVVFQLAYNSNLEGMTLGISGHYSTPGSNYYPVVVAAAFLPNGTLISMSDPREAAVA